MYISCRSYVKILSSPTRTTRRPRDALPSQHGLYSVTLQLVSQRRDESPVRSSWHLFCGNKILVSPPQAVSPRCIFLGAPDQELQPGLLPDAVQPLEAELCQFEVWGRSPFMKTPKSGDWSPSQRKNAKVACYPQVAFSCVSSQMGPRNVNWATSYDGTLTPCSNG